jgi:hypothetical protein
MANEEQLSILKQGVEVWNRCREENPKLEIDFCDVNLEGAHLMRANLSGVNLSRAKLAEANLIETHLRKACLMEADLRRADLRGADLRGADLWGTHLRRVHLTEARLRGAQLRGADLSEADLREADLSGADLIGAFLVETRLKMTNFEKVVMGNTIIGVSDLRQAKQLETVVHLAPSKISTDTLANSKGEIPEDFLQGCGMSNWENEETKLYNPDLSNDEINRILYRIFDLRASQALQISPLFISYSHCDSIFVDKLENRLNKKSIRFWRDIHEMRSGRLEKQVDMAIRQNPTVLLVLSEHSLSSDWVEHEVRMGRQLEKDLGRDVLCPIALDDSWKSLRWPKPLVEQIMEYNILDFSAWRDDSKFEVMFRKLIDGLELFYKG